MPKLQPTEDQTRERARRLRLTEKLITRQLPGSRIIRHLVAKFEVDERTARTYMAEAWARIGDDSEAERPMRKARMRETLQSLLRSHMAAGQRQAANRVVDMLCRLDGLYAPEQVRLDVTVGIPVQIEQIMDVLDDAGLQALELVMAQVEAAGVKALPSGNPSGNPSGEGGAVAEPAPLPLVTDEDPVVAKAKARRRARVIDVEPKP